MDIQSENRINFRQLVKLIPTGGDFNENYKYYHKKWMKFLKVFAIEVKNIQPSHHDYSFTKRNQEFVLKVLNDYATDESMKRFKNHLWQYDDQVRYQEIFLGIMHLMEDAGKDNKTCIEQLSKMEYTIDNAYNRDLDTLKYAIKSFEHFVERELNAADFSNIDKLFLLRKMRYDQIALLKKWSNVIKYIKNEQNSQLVELINSDEENIYEFFADDQRQKLLNEICKNVNKELNKNPEYIQIGNVINQWDSKDQMSDYIYQQTLRNREIEKKTMLEVGRNYGFNESEFNLIDMFFHKWKTCPALYEKAIKHFEKGI